jgi:murein DD-endopeptidase MepM/ murein hydrolase activator NlpD
MRFTFGLILSVAIAFVAYIAGSLYPAPPELMARLDAQSVANRIQQELQIADVSSLRASLGQQRFDDLAARASRLAAAAGSAVMVEHQADQDVVGAEAPESNALPATPAAPHAVEAARPTAPSVTPPPSSAPAVPLATAVAPGAANAGGFEQALFLCPGMTITNAPAANARRELTAYIPIVNVNGVHLAVDPTHNTCLSSGFGMRGSHMHKGIDFYDGNGGPIMAAGDGAIIEMKYRDDYGNMILIDHGHGVYTRYCHLSAFQRGLAVGSQVKAGDQLGLMGNTAAYPLPIHLHFELLLGDYHNPKQSFGLTPHSPFEFHA